MDDVQATLTTGSDDAPGSARVTAASVAICAYSMNRWSDLTAAVDSVVRQLRVGDECLVVIDHNDELLAKAASAFRSDGVVRVRPNAGTRGLSGARNTAVRASRGDVIAFLDDDAVANPGWLAGVMNALTEANVLGVGTASVPAWPSGRRPAWFPPEFDWVVGCSYRGLPTRPSHVRNVMGVAM